MFGNSEKDALPPVKDLSAAIDEQTGKFKENAGEILGKTLSDNAAKYVALGGRVGDYTRAVMGQGDAQTRVNALLVSTAAHTIAGSDAWLKLSKSHAVAGMTAADVAKILVSGTDAQKKALDDAVSLPGQHAEGDLRKVKDLVAGQSDVTKTLTSDTSDLTDTKKKMTDAANESAAAQQKETSATKDFADQLDKLPDQVTLAIAALDKLAGRAPTVEQALSDESAAFQATVDKFGIGTTKTVNGVTTSAQTRVDPSVVLRTGEIDTSTGIGRDLRDTAQTMREAIVTAAQAASDAVLQATPPGSPAEASAAARQKATEGVASFISIESQVLGSRAAALRLAGGYGVNVNSIVAAVNANTTIAQQKQHDLLNPAPGAEAGAAGMARGGSVWGGIPGVDSVHILAQHGEFVSNTAAANAHRHELQAWNAQGYAGGGSVTPAGPDRWGGGRTVTIAPGGIQISVDASGASPAEVALYASQAFRRSLEQAFNDDVDRRL
jgi:hypothetical protein